MTGGRGNRGFSLLEVMVAITIMGIVGLAYVSVQRQNLRMVEDVQATWEHINLAQQFFVLHPPEEQTAVEYSQTWIPWEPDSELAWKLEPGDPETDTYTGTAILQTRAGGTVMSWEWIRP